MDYALKWTGYFGGQGYDGVLGLGAKDPESHDYYNSPSLMDKLDRDHFISQPVFALYISLKPGNFSHIKFGGWDKSAILGKTDPVAI